ncbi:MAG: leucine-rich repeat domain-containing protein [Oscillospiraceae bacterium]|nr:leucine-rich repeat domain-containing protein [Oscillospiraceae bacterium]
MNKVLRTILIILLALAVLCGGFWYFFVYRSGLPASLYTSYAAFCSHAGDAARSARYYEKALELEPDNADLALSTADAFVADDNYTKAEYTLVCAISRNPENLDLYLRLSAVYVEQNKLLDAERLVSACANPAVKESLIDLRPSAPVIQPDGGYLLEPEDFSLSYSGGSAYYSLTEEYPTMADQPYSEPVSLDYGVTEVSAIVVGDNGLVSPLSTAKFTVCGSIEEVTFEDEAFDTFVRELLGKDRHDKIMTSELWDVQELTLPAEITNLSDLRYFVRLHSLTMQGTANLSPLADLSALTTLDLSGAALQPDALAVIGSIKTLTTLSLRGCSLTSISDLSGLTSLTALDVSGNQLTDLTPLTGMSALQALNLAQNAITSITPLAAARQLTSLDLSGNPIESLGPLSANEALVTLKLASCSAEDLSPLENKTALTTLDASGNQLTSLSGLEHCTALTDLNVANNLLTDLAPLTGLTGLQYLDASGNQLESMPQFPAESALLTINVSINRLTDVSGLSALQTLNYLNVSDNRLTDLSCLAELPKLVEVDALKNPLVGIASLEEHSIVVNYDPGYTLPSEETAETTTAAPITDGSGKVSEVG